VLGAGSPVVSVLAQPVDEPVNALIGAKRFAPVARRSSWPVVSVGARDRFGRDRDRQFLGWRALSPSSRPWPWSPRALRSQPCR